MVFVFDYDLKVVRRDTARTRTIRNAYISDDVVRREINAR